MLKITVVISLIIQSQVKSKVLWYTIFQAVNCAVLHILEN